VRDAAGGGWAETGCAPGAVCVPSFATLSSAGGLGFGVVNIVGNFGTVFVDQAYWQSAIAARPQATVRGFLIGGLVWFAIPFCMAPASRSQALGPCPGSGNHLRWEQETGEKSMLHSLVSCSFTGMC
jgi:hypothetical protein